MFVFPVIFGALSQRPFKILKGDYSLSFSRVLKPILGEKGWVWWVDGLAPGGFCRFLCWGLVLFCGRNVLRMFRGTKTSTCVLVA